jgi:S-adenosylmethionine hydrolase
MARPILALLTDFGLRDHYVGAMKAVILGICPDATIFDVTHDIPPQDVVSGALELEATVAYLPPGTVVVAVVDPGVGSRRKAVAVEVAGLRLVGPDNGLIELAVRGRTDVSVVEISNPAYMRPTVSRTFEGRDRFAPAAAWLASGIALNELGPSVDSLVPLDLPMVTGSEHDLAGTVMRVDRFGNLVTNITSPMLERIGGTPSISIGQTTIDRLSTCYADLAHGAIGALVGSQDRLEIAVNGGSAAGVLNVGRGAAVRVRARQGA